MKPIIETKRLILRDIDMVQDFDALADMTANETTMRFLGGKTLSRAEAWRNTALLIGHKQIRGYSFMSVIEKASGAWVGRVGPWFPEGWPEPEIGWAIHPAHCRKGFAKEAAAGCVDYVFNELGWDRVIHMIAAENIGSIKTAQSIGSEKMYEVKDLPPFGDHGFWAYGQTRN